MTRGWGKQRKYKIGQSDQNKLGTYCFRIHLEVNNEENDDMKIFVFFSFKKLALNFQIINRAFEVSGETCK